MPTLLPTVLWSPQPGPQTAYVTCPLDEVFYGGARGGGKTDGSLGDWALHCSTASGRARGLFIRRELTQLDDVILRAKELFLPIGAKWKDQSKTLIMPGGDVLKFRYLDRDEDAEKYQGHNYTRVYIEEIQNFPSPKPINYLRGTLRSASGVHAGMRCTGNPGGPGHHWVFERYVKPNLLGYEPITETFTNPFNNETVSLTRVFIPAKLKDNALLMKNDPGYVGRLYQAGSTKLVRAWLEGVWDGVDGAYFDNFDSRRHVLDRSWFYMIPQHATRFRAMDWGSAKPFSVGWYAISDGTWGLPYGAMLKYREWYGVGEKMNTGIKMSVEMVADGIKSREAQEHITYGVADPAIFTRDGGPSHADKMLARGVGWMRADNKRVTGWKRLYDLLGPLNSDGNPEGPPSLYFLSECQHTIRTLSLLLHSKTNPEDVDTDGEDHAGDETRYAAQTYINVTAALPSQLNVQQQQPFTAVQHTFNDLLALKRAAHNQERPLYGR